VRWLPPSRRGGEGREEAFLGEGEVEREKEESPSLCFHTKKRRAGTTPYLPSKGKRITEGRGAGQRFSAVPASAPSVYAIRGQRGRKKKRGATALLSYRASLTERVGGKEALLASCSAGRGGVDGVGWFLCRKITSLQESLEKEKGTVLAFERTETGGEKKGRRQAFCRVAEERKRFPGAPV